MRPNNRSREMTRSTPPRSMRAREFRFVVVDDFDGSEPVFKRFERYRLDPEVHEACRNAVRAIASS